MAWWLVVGALLLAAAVMTLGVLAGSEPALRWAARQAQGMSDHRLVVQGLSGSLYGPLQIEALSYASASTRYEVKALRLNWSPSGLGQRLQIDQLAVEELRITQLDADATPPHPPDSLRLPIRVSMPDLQIARLVVATGQTEHIFTDLALAIDQADDSYRVKLSRLSTPWGQARAEFKLAAAAPFALAGDAALVQQGELPYRLALKFSGPLERLDVDASASAHGGRADAVAVVKPLAAQPLTEARFTFSGIDPARWRAGLPGADLGGRLVLHGTAANTFSGEIELDNASPGRWDQSRLPLRRLSGKFTAGLAPTRTSTPLRLSLLGLRLDLGAAGRVAGQGEIGFDPRTNGLTITQARLSVGGGRLNFDGTLGLAAPRRFELRGALRDVNPAAFGDYPPARVNASFSGAGQLLPAPAGTLQFTIAGSAFRGQALSGHGQINFSPRGLGNSALTLQLARNRLSAEGRFGAPGDRLNVELDADNLAVIDPRLAGRIKASGALQGSFAAPAGQFEIHAEALRWGADYEVGRLDTTGRLDAAGDGRFDLDAVAEAIVTPRFGIDRSRLSAHGERSQHALEWTASNREFALAADFSGGWQETGGWSGRLLKLVNRGAHPLALQAPADLAVAPGTVSLGAARFDFAGGRVAVQEATYRDGRITSQGEFSGIAAADLQQLAAPAAALKTELRLAGAWRIDARDQFNGHFEANAEDGQISLPAEPEASVDLQRLRLEIEVIDNRVAAWLDAAGTRLGQLKVAADSVLSRRDGVWGVAGDAPLTATAEFALAAIGWATPLFDRSGALRLDGSLAATLRAGGTWGQPALTGKLSGERFRIEQPELGLKLEDGNFVAELADRTLVLKTLHLRGGAGRLDGEGRLALNADRPDLHLTFRANQLEVLSRPDRLLIVSGSGRVAVIDRKIEIAGTLKADRGLIDLPSGDAPSPSGDVIVLGREPPADKALPYALRLDLGIDFGEKFFLKGRGLDAQLSGDFRLVSVDGRLPRASGSVRIEKGTYAAYGQRLEIESGRLNFQGPIDNPGLAVIAMRKNQPVEAGLQLTGSALTPRVTLISRPTVPDSEKLSWLVLGRGIEGASGQDVDALQLAAGALLAAGESITLQQRIARATGIDEVSLRGGGTLQSSVLALGKRLSSKVYLSYEHGLAGTESLFKIKYALSRKLSLQTQSGTTPAADLFYTISFD